MKETAGKKMEAKRLVGDAACCLVIIGLCLAVALPRYCSGIDLKDEGFLAYGAERVMKGQIPNGDFFSLQPPLSFYIVALVFKFFGTSLLSLRGLGLSVYILIPVFIYLLSRCLTGRVMSLAAAIPATVIGMPAHNFAPIASDQGIVVTLIAAFFVMRVTADTRSWWMFTIGLITGLLMLLRHDQCVYFSGAFLAYVLVLKFAGLEGSFRTRSCRMLGFWAGGVIMVMLPAVIYWFVEGALPHVFKQLVVFPLTRYAKTSSLPMPGFSFYQPLSQNILVVLFYLPPAVGALTIIWLLVSFARRRFCTRHAHIAFIVVLSILYYHQVLVRSDVFHLIDALPPFFVLCGCLLGVWSDFLTAVVIKASGRNGLKASFISAVAVLFVAGTIWVWFFSHTKSVFLRLPERPVRRLLLERGGVFLEAEYALAIEEVVRKIQTHAKPDRSVLCLPYHPMFYFLSARRNPTYWNYLWPGDQTPRDHKDFIRQAKSDQPGVVVVFDRPDMERYEPVIIEYLNAEYWISEEKGGMTVYLPFNKGK